MGAVPHMPRARQSIKPSMPILLAVLAILATMAVVILAVGVAVSYGGNSCPNVARGTGNDECR
jgi:hypothetical protein